MKILLVSLFLPRQDARHAGGRYVYELVRLLSRRHEVDLVTRLEEEEFPSLEPLRPFCRNIFAYPYRTVARRRIWDKARLVLNYLGFSRFADRLIRSGGYDLVQVEWVEAAILIRRHGTPMILDAHDAITKPAERRYLAAAGLGRLAGYLRYLLVLAMEKGIVGRFDQVSVRSEADREYLRGINPLVDARVVPHPAGLDFTGVEFPREAWSILFLASFRYRPTNVEAALWLYNRVFPVVRRALPGVRLIIAGYGPPPELTALAERDPQVAVPGFVESLESCHKRAGVFVAPILIGGGIIVKILDAMAAGTPVVTTSFGNEGVGAMSGRDLLVADQPEEFAEQVVRLLRNPDLGRQIGENGRQFVRQHFSIESIESRLDGIYADMLAGQDSPPTG